MWAGFVNGVLFVRVRMGSFIGGMFVFEAFILQPKGKRDRSVSSPLESLSFLFQVMPELIRAVEKWGRGRHHPARQTRGPDLRSSAQTVASAARREERSHRIPARLGRVHLIGGGV
jgi:hypothetical protein